VRRVRDASRMLSGAHRLYSVGSSR
jgi:hypothetical protein